MLLEEERLKKLEDRDVKMVLVFNKWAIEGVSVSDAGLVDYINIQPKIVPKSSGRHAKRRFHKSKLFICERLMNKLAVNTHKGKEHYIQKSGSQTGKGSTMFNLMKKTLEIIEKKTKENPLAVLVRAIENAAPRDEVVSIEYGGARYPKAVDISPQRRIDLALRYMTQGALQKSFQKSKTIESALADEIMFAADFSNNSAAISKKLELERQADASR